MRKLIATLITATLLTFGLPAPAASAAWADCNFVMFDYGAWPGTGSYDTGKSIGIARSGKNFGSHAQDDACASIESPQKAIIWQSLASQGRFTWWLVGPEVSNQEHCLVAVLVNGQEVALLDAQPMKPEGGYTVAQLQPNAEAVQQIADLLVPGPNEITAVPDCSTIDASDLVISSTLEVHEDSYSEFDGVTINEGEEFTNTRDVKISLSSSSLVAQVAISNDGGFPKSQTQIFNVTNNTIDWTLKASSGLQMSRKVYVRYRLYDVTNDGALGAWQKQTYSDDIILDTTAPVITKTSVASVSGGVQKVLDQVSLAQRKLKRLQLTAKDDKSGVAEYQISTVAKAGTGVSSGYGSATTVAIAKTRKTVFVRARDVAGNWSTWKSVATD